MQARRAIMGSLRTLFALLLVVTVLAPLASAATTPVLVDRINKDALVADSDAPAVAQFLLFNLNPNDEFYVRVSVDKASGWRAVVEPSASVDPSGFFLKPRENLAVNVSFEPLDAVAGHTFHVSFRLVHDKTGEVTSLVEEVTVDSRLPPRVLGVFQNRLPAPLDTAYGTFALELAFWVATGLAAVFVGDTIVRAITARASDAVTVEILHKLRKPVFYFVFFLGLARSFSLLPKTPVTDFLSRTLVAIGVGIFGLYVLYRILDAGLLYYSREIAPRTETTVDDLIVPVIRKVGIVALYVVGIVNVLRTLGWDPTIIFAGAGIAGLVIAFAAQDTFSNLFSGIFLLLDRPFKEGDDIKLETGEITRVQNIGLRTTRLYHPRNHELITVPNNQLATKRIINLSGPDTRYWVMVDIGAAYASNAEHVKRVLLDLANAHPKVSQAADWEPAVIFKNFGESSLDFILRFSVEDFKDRFAVASELRYQIHEAFEREGIEIPFPQRTVWLRKEDEATPTT